MANEFCRLLSNGYKINVNNNRLDWSPCCFYSKKTPLLDQTQFEAELKYTSSATGWLPECNQCRRMEASGVPGLSPRLNSFKKVPTVEEDGRCVALEINTDLTCNAACLSCGSYASSTWKKYENKHGVEQHNPQQDSKNADRWFNQLINRVDLSSVRDVFILGGEPFYGTTNLKFLRHLYQVHPALDQVVLQYQTNGSIIPDPEVLELWKSFKTVILSLSIDGVGKRFNYLRWPLKWHRVEKTVDFMLSTTDALLTVNATVNPLNVLYFDEIEQWVADTIPDARLPKKERLYGPVRPNRCMNPMNLNLTTPSLRADVLAKYGADHSLSKIFSNIEFNNKYQQMFDHVNQHDQLRRLSWAETFPATVKYYKTYT